MDRRFPEIKNRPLTPWQRLALLFCRSHVQVEADYIVFFKLFRGTIYVVADGFLIKDRGDVIKRPPES